VQATPSVWNDDDVASFINEYYEAWSGTDLDRIMSYYADNVVIQIPGALIKGKQALLDQFVRPFITAFPGNRHLIKNIMCGPGSVAVEFSFEANHTGPFRGNVASGAGVKFPGSGFYEYDSVKRQVTGGRIYFDVTTLLKSISNLPTADPKKAAEALHLNERNLSVIINAIPTAAWSTRPDGYCDFLNQRWLDYAGMTAEQAEGWGWAETIHPDDRERLTEVWQSALGSGSPVETEARMRRYDGAYRWFLFRANAVRNEDGKIIKWYGTNVDIEDRKRVEQALKASELSWRQIVDNIPGLVATMAASGDVEFLNRQTLDYFGRTDEDLKNWSMIGVVHPDDLPRVIEVRTKSIETGQIYEIEHRCLGADGVYRWFQVRGLPVRNDEGAITAWYLLLTDIEDLKKAQEALQSSERNLRQITNAIPTNIHVLRSDGSVLYVNQPVLDYTGLTMEETLREDYRARVFHPEDLRRINEERRDALTRPELFENEQRALGKDGKYRWFLARYNPLLNEQGGIDRWYVASVDIDDRKQVEAELQKSEAKHRRVIDAIPALAWCNLPDGPNEFLSKPWHEYTGLTPEESQGWGWQVAFHPDDLPPLMERWTKMLVSGEPDEIEARLRRHDGVYRWFLIRAEPFRDESGEIIRWYGTSTDIDDRKRAEEELRRSEAILAEAQRVSKTGSFITDLLSDEHNWSEELCRIFELSPGTRVTSEAIRALFHPEDLPVYEEAFKRAVVADQDIDINYRIITPAGKVKHLHAVSHLLDKTADQPVYIGAIQDVTESKVAEQALTRARAELAHMSRVTTLSALTASISHEINQPISAVITSAGACLRWLDREQPEVQRARDAATRIEEDGKRAAEIITNLRSFYRKDGAPNRAMVLVDDIVREMLVLLRSEADRHSVVMRTDVATDVPRVCADRVQLRQVLMNLMLNGMEAMSEREGELTISAKQHGEDVMVSVSDTGVGIPADKLEQVFNEFFTTKAEGTGMGLAISRTIIESHGGRLWAGANPQGGAVFHFTLPTQPEGAR
jgi:PAS domain S-box-containing protein